MQHMIAWVRVRLTVNQNFKNMPLRTSFLLFKVWHDYPFRTNKTEVNYNFSLNKFNVGKGSLQSIRINHLELSLPSSLLTRRRKDGMELPLPMTYLPLD